MSNFSPFIEQPKAYAEVQLVETIEDKINRVAEAHKIATTSLYNLAMSESSLGEKRVGDGGDSCGIIHHMRQFYPEQFARCDDDEYILNFAAEQIAQGNGDIYVPGNCYAFVRALLGKIPKMSEIQPNTAIPRKGEIAIFYYKGKKHIAVEDEILEDGFWVREANFLPFVIGRRFIKWNDPAFAGFYSLPDIRLVNAN